MNRSEIFTRAWNIYRNSNVTFSQALKKSWKFHKIHKQSYNVQNNKHTVDNISDSLVEYKKTIALTTNKYNRKMIKSHLKSLLSYLIEEYCNNRSYELINIKGNNFYYVDSYGNNYKQSISIFN